MKTHVVSIAALIVLSTAAGAQTGTQRLFGARHRAKPVYAQDGIYLALPPKNVPTSGAQTLTWSNDGRCILLVRQQAAQEIDTIEDAIESILPRRMQTQKQDFGTEIDSFNVMTGETKPIWHSDADGITVRSADPIGKYGSFLIVLMKDDESVSFHYKISSPGALQPDYETPGQRSWAMLVDGENLKWKFVPRFENRLGMVASLVSPTEAKAVLTVESPDRATTKEGAVPLDDGPKSEMIDINGTAMATWDQAFTNPNWMADGKSFFWLDSIKNHKPIFATLGADGKPAVVQGRPTAYQPPVDASPITAIEVPFRSADKLHLGQVNGIYLHPRGVKASKDVSIAAGGREPVMNPSGDAVLYRLGTEYKTVRIVKAPPESLEALKRALKSEALNFAKQAGLAALMYSNDWDDKYPGGKDEMMPYLKDEDILDSFNYTMAGGTNATSIESPAETEMGYVNGPGGRAVVYSDGHAKWIPDPTP